MKNLSLFTKIFLGYLLVIVLFTALIFFISFTVIKNKQVDLLETDLKEKAIILRERFKPYLIENRLAHLDSLVKLSGSSINHRVTIIAADGLVLADSEREPRIMDNHLNRDEVQAALNTQDSGSSLRYSLTIKQDMLYVAIPILENGTIHSYIRISLWLTEIDELVAELKFQFFKSILLMIFISLLLALFFSRTISTPIKKLVDFARNLPKDKFKRQLEVKSKDEIGALSESMNLMGSEIHKLFKQQGKDNEELFTIIESMREGLVVINKDKKVLLANSSLRKIFKVQETDDRYIWEVIKSKEFLDQFDLMLKAGLLDNIEITYDNRSYSVGLTKKPNRPDIIAIFHDISESRELETKKRDFVSNVSHELRTPLTAIKGFIETLEDGESDSEKKHFLKIIHRNTDRLIHLVTDLLLLSRLESNDELDLEKTDLEQFIDTLLHIFKQKSENTGIKIDFTPRNKKTYVMVDRFKMEQVFINLIDNAFNYSDKGPIKIEFDENNTSVIIKITDNGIGIKKENIDRVFERFYVVDKARSRKLSGTGLGLSLVKHIIQLHDGEISVESESGKGTTFIVRLKKT